ncbi:hypothetical protein D3273_26440 [Lichenibacterium minor]|uniref:Cysteine rich repeat-containing protein n=1 Tax=Lichenibacterium minor TaxID=2316528 RepID=A0A4V1RTV4_9HYPH|nr:hypothetical protein [Lichenibacterium minor]RYC28964.1 hypothetical protein D3273_26440 [Lichenibacterium minor]
MRFAALLGIVTMLAFSITCRADEQDISPALRQKAIAVCTVDAERLCPDSVSSENQAISCLAGKRSELTSACKSAYDEVAHALKQ